MGLFTNTQSAKELLIDQINADNALRSSHPSKLTVNNTTFGVPVVVATLNDNGTSYTYGNDASPGEVDVTVTSTDNNMTGSMTVRYTRISLTALLPAVIELELPALPVQLHSCLNVLDDELGLALSSEDLNDISLTAFNTEYVITAKANALGYSGSFKLMVRLAG